MATSTALESSSGPAWELSKENAAPLARGRNVKVLSRALSTVAESDEQKNMNEKKVRRFERLVGPSERAAEEAAKRDADGAEDVEPDSILKDIMKREGGHDRHGSDDPLVHWLSYIKFLQETYPSDTKEQFLLLERCTRSIVTFPRYRNDARFIRVCVLYADQTSAPSDIFKYLHQRKVGTYTALFWIAWAWVAEKSGDYPFAEKVFHKGLSKKAKPTKMLEERQRQFQRRMSRHWLNNASKRGASEGVSEGDEEGQADQENRRGALSGLTSEGARRNHRSHGANPAALTSGSSRADNIGNVGGVRGMTSSLHSSSRGSSAHVSTFGSHRANSGSRRHASNGAKAKTGFSIFVEEDDENNGGYNLDQSVDCGHIGGGRRIEKESDRRKENTARTERWNERGGLGSSEGADDNGDEHHRGVGRSFAARMAARDPSPTPAFQVFVDEECAANNEREEETARKEREQRRREIGDRSLMQRVDGGVADRLTRDPLRYVRNPSKMESDKTKYGDDCLKSAKKKSRLVDDTDARPPAQKSKNCTKEKKSDKRVPLGFSKRLISKGEDGQEKCFEEGRARARYFNLVSSSVDFNLLEIIEEATMGTRESSAMDMDASSINDVEMEDEDRGVNMEGCNDSMPLEEEKMLPDKRTLSPRQEVGQNSSGSKETKIRKVLFGLNASIGSAAHNTSTASSTFDEQNAVGVPMGKEEETINTKFAMKELSMMFSSPAMGCGGGAANLSVIAAASEQQGDESTEASSRPLFSLHRKPSNISTEEEEVNPEREGSSDTANFSLLADIMDNCENEGTSASILVGSDQNVKAGENSENQHPTNLLRNAEFDRCALKKMGSKATAEVKVERNVLSSTGGAGPTFGIFCDDGSNGAGDDAGTEEIYEKDAAAAGAAFEIFCDEGDSADKPDATQQQPDETAPFSIFVDREHEQEEDDGSVADNADTATLSVIGETFKGIVGSEKANRKKKDGRSVGFAIFEDNGKEEEKEQRSSHRRRKSMFDKTGVKEDATKATSAGFSIFCEEDENEAPKVDTSGNEVAMTDGNVITENARFGDISRIAPDDIENCGFSGGLEEEPIEYDNQHSEDIDAALQDTMKEAARESERGIMDHSSIQMPRALLQKLPSRGIEIEIGNVVATVRHELGRGAYGVVLLCDSSDGAQEFSSALKVQTPTGCLAWEFDILRKIEDRIPELEGPTKRVTSRRRRSRDDADDCETLPPFPRALSFVNFSDGGLLSMTAGSTSGLNLVDVVNAHRGTGGGPVPELIAIHYTARMLKQVESLHFYGKILHCDIKPDNWVLTASASACGTKCDAVVAGSDLMLVDFGRAIDLKTAGYGVPDPKKIKLCGDAAAKDMACAAIREGLPWAADIDTFGVCASAFVLLYGFHMDIEKDRVNKRWKPHKPLRRYWNKALWKEMFDALLNEGGSDPNSLRAIRKSFEGYLDEGNRRKHLETELKHQASILPKKR